MVNVSDEKLSAVRENIFNLEPWVKAALEGEMLPNHEIVIEWFDGEGMSVILNVSTGAVIVGSLARNFEGIPADDDDK